MSTHRHISLLIELFCLTSTLAFGQDSLPATTKPQRAIKTATAEVPPVVHSSIGDSSAGWNGEVRLINIGKRQQFNPADRPTLDRDILSPKSVNFSPDGKRCYVNSLEGCKTVVYAMPTLQKIDVIEHRFKSSDGPLWAAPSGFYPFEHYPDGATKAFSGKPVEATFSHDGRYLWVPYYRRTFDINAQDPSAIAVIDTRTDSIVRMFETGPLPKMVAYCKERKLIAVTHWGDNTVGLIDVKGATPAQWHHLPPMVADHKLPLHFPLDTPIDRDVNSGYKLRGTVFTPDGNYLLVSSMGGPMHAFRMAQQRYVGAIESAYGIRHLLIRNGKLYGSRNSAGEVVSVPLDSVLRGIKAAELAGSKVIQVRGWRRCKVGGGARTLDATPDGELLFVACNTASKVYVVQAATMAMVDSIRVDSYPVGLDVSPDGTLLAVTSQARKGFGGNALNLFRIVRPAAESATKSEAKQPLVVADTEDDASDALTVCGIDLRSTETILMMVGAGLIIVVLCTIIVLSKKKKKRKLDCEYQR
jgi:DNA-binding beta-propeller fold protein YncE